MKVFLLCLSILSGTHALLNNFYQLSFDALDGTAVNTSTYQDKKVVIAVIGANDSGQALVRFLDSIQTAQTNLQVIAVPTGDFGSSVNEQNLVTLKQNTSIVLTKPLSVKKSNLSLQHPLFQWLTQATKNSHFDLDVSAEGQLFIVNDEGALYAVCSKDTEKGVILSTINASGK